MAVACTCASAGFTASPTAQQQQNPQGLNVDFDSVFGNNTIANDLDSTVASSPNQGLTLNGHKLVSNDLDSSLANLVGNLGISNGTANNDLHWNQPGEKKLTGGNNWQPKSAPSTTWNPAAMAPSVVAFPPTTSTGMMAYGMPPQVSSMMMTQPVIRPANPFGPNPGAQMQFM
ncbi:phosphatidylinositol binding clathrin assembly protein a isoform X3 [Pseudochaenichthys georgianus]|uniref:phosphatidylinositol binding clathrin assembly protein a isoform X3 n=1 Tax=Pseudochaenichthys georgianus TaxID=52239 RepID=UPI00146CC8DF|nr:phosphatidylinositol binding clathrin assembly protein a isoform X3 [Pseudochaenichthys georgianus]